MNYLIRTSWWKILTAVLLLYTVVGGLLLRVPRLPILNETVRNLHFHVPMWFGMIFLFSSSCYYSVRYLKTKNLRDDIISDKLVQVGVIYGILGIATGMVWAQFTWGAAWSNDPKQNASAIALLIYFALLIFRGSLKDDHARARLGGVYNIFAFALLIPLLFILPRMTDSLHPGNGGNPGFNAYDLDNDLRKVFYASVAGWTLLGFWIASIKCRLGFIELETDNE